MDKSGIIKIVPTRNAVIIDYGSPKTGDLVRPVVSIECMDDKYLPMLDAQARKIVAYMQGKEG